MSKISVSEESLVSMIAILEDARRGLESSVVELKKAYVSAGAEWHDKKYQQLGEIVERANRSILSIGYTLGDAKNKLKTLQKNINDYINSGAAVNGNNSNAYMRAETNMTTMSFSEVISGFQSSNWNTMNEQERRMCVNNLANYVIDDLQLTNPPRVNYYYREPENGATSYGFYSPQDNSININTFTMNNSLETADTVAHELRHAWQRQRAANPTTAEDYSFALNLRPGCYIRYEINPLGYRNQPVERDARQYASGLTRGIE